MDAVLNPAPSARPADCWGSLPPRIKVLYITTLQRTGSHLAEAFAADSASEVCLEEVVGVTAGLARLRDEVFDALLITHEPPVMDALELIEGLRAGGAEDPMVVLGNQPVRELAALCYEVGADAYCDTSSTTTRSLIWTVARAMERHRLIRENRRFVQAERQRLRLEHREAERMLSQQRMLIAELATLQQGPSAAAAVPAENTDADHLSANTADPPPTVCSLPERLTVHYRELLRAHVIMGTGNLADEMTTLADLLASAGVTARQTMQLHLHVLEQLIHGLGNRSARHVLNRADLLILEVMAQLAEGYRQRYCQRRDPPSQKLLPGFDQPAPPAFSAPVSELMLTRGPSE